VVVREQSAPEVAIVGGGLVGPLLAVFLVRRGLRVTVWERRPDPRDAGQGAGRSINLIVTSRGIHALRGAGLDEAVARQTVPVTGRMMHALDGTLTSQPYGRDDSECNYSISRAGLNRLLIGKAERRGVRFQFEKRLTDVDLRAGRLTFVDASSGGTVLVDASVVIGADGADSAVRAALPAPGGFEASTVPLSHGYKQLSMPAGEGGTYRIEKRALHLWPRGRILLMALPNLDGSFTATLYLPVDGPSSFRELATAGDVRALFERQFPDAVPLIPDLAERFFDNPTGSLATVRCHPWHLEGRIALIGDAAHAMAPLFGQGMNCGFEDCVVLDGLLAEHGPQAWATVWEEFARERKPHADAIADMSLENFDELRDRVADARFLLRKEVEHRLEQDWPLEYRSRYSMVMFGDVPYRVAREAGRIQEEILDDLCDGLESAGALDVERARRLIRERLEPYLTTHDVDLSY
jgi:kynurenine 3-monooxygenase